MTRNNFNFIHSGLNLAAKNMENDRQLLKDVKPGDSPMMRFYDFVGPSATYGYFLNLQLEGIDLARRPTGGGVVFHMWDLTFSLLIPSMHPLYTMDTMTNYRQVHEIVMDAIRECFRPLDTIHLMGQDCPEIGHFCFARPVQYDVMIGGKKVAGGAIRKKKNGFLYQGSIALTAPDFVFLKEVVQLQREVLEGMKLYTYSFAHDLQDAKKALTFHLQQSFQRI